ncbi:hypothetical protein IMSAGC008_01272 [Muribaculaceae bacterium]|nr:hypothetical protein IMSAGC008_01272 [Muribaculaceae bacterium]
MGGRVHRPDAGLAHQAGAGQQQRPAQRPAQRRHSPRQPQGRPPELPAVDRPLAQRRGSLLRRQRPQLDLHPARAAKLGNRHLRQDSQQQARRAGCPLPQRGIRPGRPQPDNIGRGFDLLLHSRRPQPARPVAHHLRAVEGNRQHHARPQGGRTRRHRGRRRTVVGKLLQHSRLDHRPRIVARQAQQHHVAAPQHHAAGMGSGRQGRPSGATAHTRRRPHGGACLPPRRAGRRAEPRRRILQHQLGKSRLLPRPHNHGQRRIHQPARLDGEEPRRLVLPARRLACGAALLARTEHRPSARCQSTAAAGHEQLRVHPPLGSSRSERRTHRV